MCCTKPFKTVDLHPTQKGLINKFCRTNSINQLTPTLSVYLVGIALFETATKVATRHQWAN